MLSGKCNSADALESTRSACIVRPSASICYTGFLRMRPVQQPGPGKSLRLFSALVIVPFLATATIAGEAAETAGQDILGKYLEAKETQKAAMRGVQMEVDIDAKLPKQEKHGTLHALRSISRLGKITYKALGFSGDNSIKSEVIARYLSEETKPHDNAISPVNYKFKYKGYLEQSGQRIHVFDVTPRKKAEGLFRGQLWLDALTGMPIRETGHPVKTSLLVKKMEFVQDYEIRDGIAFPKHFQGTADLRIIGRAELKIDYSHFTRQETGDDANDANRQ